MMSNVPTYEELFLRNLGVVNAEQQEQIRSLDIAIVGCGGIGSPAAYLLARLGVGTIRIADPETFEPSNVNRQFGAYADTIGKNKAQTMCDELKRINPHITTHANTGGIDSKNITQFLASSSVVIDAVDFFNAEISILLLKACGVRKSWVYTAQGACDVLSITAFDPHNDNNDSHLVDEHGTVSLEHAITALFPVLPATITPVILNDFIVNARTDAPSWVPVQVLGASLLAQEIVRTAVLGLLPAVVFPDVLLFDGHEMSLRVYSKTRPS